MRAVLNWPHEESVYPPVVTFPASKTAVECARHIWPVTRRYQTLAAIYHHLPAALQSHGVTSCEWQTPSHEALQEVDRSLVNRPLGQMRASRITSDELSEGPEI